LSWYVVLFFGYAWGTLNTLPLQKQKHFIFVLKTLLFRKCFLNENIFVLKQNIFVLKKNFCRFGIFVVTLQGRISVVRGPWLKLRNGPFLYIWNWR